MLFSLKTVQRSKLTDKQLEQLVQEVKIQSSLNHPSIVKLYAFTADKQYIYLLLEACLGGNLYQTLKGKALDEGVARDHVRRVCEAVEYLHERHIMHRDIKS
jgi:serine/threonine protein kinase